MSYAQRIQNIMDKFHCSREAAIVVIELRNEGYSICQATLMAGVTDPDYWNRTKND